MFDKLINIFKPQVMQEDHQCSGKGNLESCPLHRHNLDVKKPWSPDCGTADDWIYNLNWLEQVDDVIKWWQDVNTITWTQPEYKKLVSRYTYVLQSLVINKDKKCPQCHSEQPFHKMDCKDKSNKNQTVTLNGNFNNLEVQLHDQQSAQR